MIEEIVIGLSWFITSSILSTYANQAFLLHFTTRGDILTAIRFIGSSLIGLLYNSLSITNYLYNQSIKKTTNNRQKNNEYKKFSMEDLKELNKKFNIECGFSEKDQKDIFDKVNNTYYVSSYIGDAYVTLFSIVTLRMEEKFLKEQFRKELKEELLQEILNERLPVKSNDSKLIKI